MITAITVVLVIISLILHELAHAKAMHKAGIKLELISIGIPCPLKIRFYLPKLWGGVWLQFTPLLIMAYVKPTQGGMLKLINLDYKQTADIAGAGPLTNIIFAAILLLIGRLIYEEQNLWLVIWSVPTLVLVSIPIIFFSGRQIISRFVLLPLGIAATIFLIWGLITTPLETVTGPVEIWGIISQSTNLGSAMINAGLISLSIALFNILPIGSLDGGKIIEAIMRRLSKRKMVYGVYQSATIWLFLALIIFAIISDFIK
ncbi:MAG: M50 family metallopeptidase [Patescibacteria group bacterium]